MSLFRNSYVIDWNYFCDCFSSVCMSFYKECMKSSDCKSFSLNWVRSVWYFMSIFDILVSRDAPPLVFSKFVRFGICINLSSREMDGLESSDRSEGKLRIERSLMYVIWF